MVPNTIDETVAELLESPQLAVIFTVLPAAIVPGLTWTQTPDDEVFANAVPQPLPAPSRANAPAVPSSKSIDRMPSSCPGWPRRAANIGVHQYQTNGLTTVRQVT